MIIMKIEKSLCDALVSLAQMNSQNCLSEDVIFQYTEQEGLSLPETNRVCQQIENAGVKIVSQAEYDAAITSIQLHPALTSPEPYLSIDQIAAAFSLLSSEEKIKCLNKLQQFSVSDSEKDNNQSEIVHAIDSKIKTAFLERIEQMRLRYSYIPVLLLTFLSTCDSSGKADFDVIVNKFRDFYESRAQNGYIVENKKSVFVKLKYTKPSVGALIRYDPLRKSFLRKYMYYNLQANKLCMEENLWNALTENDLVYIKGCCQNKIAEYYEIISRNHEGSIVTLAELNNAKSESEVINTQHSKCAELASHPPIYNHFMKKIHGLKLQYSYMAVLLNSFFKVCDGLGKADFDSVANEFSDFYTTRARSGKLVEQADSMIVKFGFAPKLCKSLIIHNPLGRSFLKQYFQYEKHDNTLSIRSDLWRELSNADLLEIMKIVMAKLDEYYLRIATVHRNEEDPS